MEEQLLSQVYVDIYLWDLLSVTLKNELNGYVFGNSSIAFSPDGKTIANGGNGGLFMWEVDSGARKMAIADHLPRVDAISFSPDSKTLATGHWYNINLWDTENGQLKTTFYGSRFTYNRNLDFSSDGSILASIIWGGISLWECKLWCANCCCPWIR